MRSIDPQTVQAIREFAATPPEIPQTEAARHFGISPETVRKYVGPSGYSTSWDTETEIRAKAMIEDRVPYGEIVRTLRVTYPTLRKKFGPSPHPRGTTAEGNRIRDMEIDLGIRKHQIKFGRMERSQYGKRSG